MRRKITIKKGTVLEFQFVFFEPITFSSYIKHYYSCKISREESFPLSSSLWILLLPHLPFKQHKEQISSLHGPVFV